MSEGGASRLTAPSGRGGDKSQASDQEGEAEGCRGSLAFTMAVLQRQRHVLPCYVFRRYVFAVLLFSTTRFDVMFLFNDRCLPCCFVTKESRENTSRLDGEGRKREATKICRGSLAFPRIISFVLRHTMNTSYASHYLSVGVGFAVGL